MEQEGGDEVGIGRRVTKLQTDLETIDKGHPVRLLWRQLPAVGAEMMFPAKRGHVPEVEGCAAPVKGDHVVGFKPACGGAFRTPPAVTVQAGPPEAVPLSPVSSPVMELRQRVRGDPALAGRSPALIDPRR